jgi:nitrile hydratase
MAAYDGRAIRRQGVPYSLSDHPHHHGHRRDQGHSDVPSDPALRTKALESLLTEKGLVDPAAIDAWIEAYERRIGPHRGAQIIARAWVDPDFKARLLQHATDAITTFGFLGREGQTIVVVENTPTIHNLIVCTLCSCYPWALLGLPPRWYKAAPYRARAVIDPRGVLAEFGLVLGDEVEVRVWDSTAELRYLVLPERPAGTDDLSEAELAALVTREAMIGVAKVKAPRKENA